MDLSKQEPTRETTNLDRIAEIIIGPCTDVLRHVLTKEITPLKTKGEFRWFLEKKHGFFVDDMCKYIETKNFSHFNIPLLYASLQWICSISPHKNKWGNFPDEQDRSLSANIERVYNTHMEYIYFQSDHLKDSIFEQEWKSVFQTIKELEKHIGSGTKHQDTLHKLKTCPMDSTYKKNSMQKLRESRKCLWGKGSIALIEDMGQLVNFLLEEEEEYKEFKNLDTTYLITESEMEEEEEEYIDKKKPFTKYHITESEMKGSKIFVLGTENHMKILETKRHRRQWELKSESEDIDSDMRSDKFQDRTEPIASKELTELFKFFNVEFPDDPLDESFARGILRNYTEKLVSLINSLSNGAVLTKDPNKLKSPSNKALMTEIDVVYEGGQFRVVKKDTSPHTFQICPRYISTATIILITSKFLPVVKAKLMVYEKYKHTINAEKIFLQHEYEEFDNVAKLIASQHLMSFCRYIESIVNAFTVDFYQIFTAHVDRPLEGKDIKKMCLKAFKESHPLKPGVSYCRSIWNMESERDWDEWIAYKINKKLSGKDLISTDAWLAIWNICRKTVEDLGVILSAVEEFRSKILPPDQDKDIAEWQKIEVIRNKSLLLEYPSIIKYIAGHNGDGKDKVKVYLSEDDEEAKQFFKKECCEVLKDPDIEFVNVEKTNEILEENEEMELLEEEYSTTDNLDWIPLTHIIQKCEKKIYARYSNVIGIQVGNVTVVDDPMQEDIGVILYCLDKNLIPFGENPLPKYIEGWPCGVKEDFFMFGACPKLCSSTDAKLPVPGCSIGIPFHNFCGSTGFLYKSNNQEDMYEYGFLTATHVAIKNCRDLYLEGKLLSDHQLGRQKHFIVHPSYQENNASNNPVGEVIESFFGDYGNPPTGLDCAVVRSDFPRQKEMKVLPVVKTTELNYKKPIKVKKTGKTTGTTYGYLMNFEKHILLSAKLQLNPNSAEYIEFQMPYVVRDMYKNNRFFREGDSGSGVFVLGEKDLPEKALGIAFGYSYKNPYTFVCNIEEILTKLNLELVRNPQDAWVWSMED